MPTTQQITEARDEYARLRAQMGFRKAAAHVMQKYGITSTELSAALRDADLVSARVVHADRVIT